MNNKLKVFTTFTGIGSPEIGLKYTGIDIELIGMSEVDKHAINAYDAIHGTQSKVVLIPSKEEMLDEIKSKNIAYNFSTGKSEIPRNIKDITKLYTSHMRNKNYGDIRLINEKTLPNFDLFTYSFPCKNISIAGEQAGLEKDSNTQSSLLWECERIIREKKPKFLLMENVKNLVGAKHIDNFKLWIKTLEDMGYNSYWKVLNCSDFMIPQNRERVMMMSVLKEFDKEDSVMPSGYRTEFCVNDFLDDTVDGKLYYEYDKYKTCDLSVKSKESNLIHIGNIDAKMHSNARVYDGVGYCPTLNSMNGGNRQPKIYTNGKVRRLSSLECWRLMGFSDEDYCKAKDIGELADSKLYERSGRGIAVPMLVEIFRVFLKDYIK